MPPKHKKSLRQQKFNVFFLALLSLSILAASCSKSSQKSLPKEGKTQVVVSLAPYAYFVEKLAGDLVEVNILIPPEANPHIYEPTPQKMETIIRASIWFGVGEPFENKLAETFLRTCPNLRYIDLSQNIHLLHGEGSCTHHPHDSSVSHDEGADRHIWLSLRLARIQAKEIATSLVTLLPEHAIAIQERLDNLLNSFEMTDLEVSSMLAPLSGRAIIDAHPAYGYFCRDYHLVQLSVECEGKDPLPQDIEILLQQAKQDEALCVFILAQYNTKPALLVAEKLGLPVFKVDPYSLNYLESFKDVALKIAESAIIQ